MTVIYGLISLCFLVIIHEAGHFIAARICKVKVESFSVGMGPVLLHKKIGQTDYRISLLPLGGYCGMKGEKDFSNAVEAGLNKIQADKDSLYGVHPLCRTFIAFAGPDSNFIFSVIALAIIALAGSSYYSPSAQIILADEVYPEIHSAARDGGLQTGDIIKSINGIKISDFSDIYSNISFRPDEDIKIVVQRNGQELTFTVHSELDKSTGTGKIGVTSTPGSVEKRFIAPLSFFPALKKGFLDTIELVKVSIKSIRTLFKGIEIKNAVSGPARITTMLGDTVKESFVAGIKIGITNTLNFMSLISISLFLLNLLPIPILDGGLVLFSIIEFIIGKQIPPKIQYYVQYIGIAFIAFLFIIGISGDIQYFISLAGRK